MPPSVTYALDDTDRRLLNAAQTSFPLDARPYRALGRPLGLEEDAVLERFRHLRGAGVLRQTSAIFDTRALGYRGTLAALRVEPERLDAAAAIVSAHPGVSHNYGRDHEYNLWFTLATPPGGEPAEAAAALAREAGAGDVLVLPTLKVYKIGVNLDLEAPVGAEKVEGPVPGSAGHGGAVPKQVELSESDKAGVRVTQEDLGVEPEPFGAWARALDLEVDGLFLWIEGMIRRGCCRRFASILRHRAAGFSENAMAVWEAPEDACDRLGAKMASFKAVTHCYRRPVSERWPYALFTMIHGRSAADCEAVVAAIRAETGLPAARLVYSVREYKKERVKYFLERLP
jgi:DNA-binding Lrp family transcriptional regulator